MPKRHFRYLIICPDLGKIFGTDSEVIAAQYLGTEDEIVIDTVENHWVLDYGINIEPIELSNDEG